MILSSCCCMLSMLLVPVYSEALQKPASELQRDAQSSWDNYNQWCVCQASKDELVAQYNELDRRMMRERLGRGSGGGMATVVSWDDLEGRKFEYSPVSRTELGGTSATSRP